MCVQTMRKYHMVNLWHSQVPEGCYLGSTCCWEGQAGSGTHWCGSLDWLGTRETYFALMAAETTALGTCYKQWLLGWQPQSGSCLSPALCWETAGCFSPVECHFSVIAFGISDSVLSQLQTHYVNLRKSTYFQILIVTYLPVCWENLHKYILESTNCQNRDLFGR